MHRDAWRRASRLVAVVLSVITVGLILMTYAGVIAASLFTDAQGRFESLVVSAIRLFGYTAVLVLVLVGLRRVGKAVTTKIDAWREESAGIRFQDAVLLSSDQAAAGAELVVRVLRFGIVVTLLCLYVPLVLRSIPATASLANRVIVLITEPLTSFASAIAAYFPNLITLILIAVAARWTLHLLRIFMDALKTGDVKLRHFEPEWADQTYRLFRIGVMGFTLVVMYPLLPGSDSAVFKGISVFVGAVATFGSQSTVNNMMSGIVLTYSRTFKVGDRVRVAGTTGDIEELGMFMTRIGTVDNESVSIPNALLMKGEIVNLSKASARGGLKMRVQVGIGYDTEWRRVYELLENAAKKTANVKSDPEPRVLQSSLDDYAVTYRLVVHLQNPRKVRATRSRLAENIQDVFNEAGLEIMTPSVQAIRNAPDPAIPAEYGAEASQETRFRVDSDSDET